MRIETINPLQEPEWDRFLLSGVEATAFHSSAWARVLRDTYGFEPRYLVAREYDGRIVGGIPLMNVGDHRMISVPFSDACPPLLPDSATGQQLLAALRADSGPGRARTVELRGQAELDLETQGFRKGGAFYHHLLPLGESMEEVEGRFHHTWRKRTRQARRAGVTVRPAFTTSDMEAFYELMLRTRKKLGVLPQPWRFFESIHRHCFSQGMGHLLLAEQEGRVVAGGIFLAFNDTLIFKFNASDPRYLEGRPNHLVYRDAMELGISLGCHWFDLGRCDLEDEGLRYFKLGWGSHEATLNYYYYPTVRAGVALSAGALRRRALSWFVRVSPLWALRQAGDMLYRRLA